MSGPENVVMRRRAAALARRYDGSRASWDSFMQEFWASEDPAIAELVDLIEHEPKRGGFLGASEIEWADYRRSVEDAIQALEQGGDS